MFNMVGCTGNCQGVDEHQYAEMYTAFRVDQLGCSAVPFSAAWENTRVMSAWTDKGCFQVENVPDQKTAKEIEEYIMKKYPNSNGGIGDCYINGFTHNQNSGDY